MTTTVHVAVNGNKEVLIQNGTSKTLLQPGAHTTFSIHGDVQLHAQEHGDFISAPTLPLVRAVLPTEGSLPPHQQRVVEEKAELDARLFKLHAFILDNPVYPTLSAEEQARLERQCRLMDELTNVLGARIAAF